jgi:N-acyl-D-amino-acid deacylase
MDENMHPVPSRFADHREKVALAQAMMNSGRGVWQVVPFFPAPAQQIENIRELGEISRASGAACSFQPLLVAPGSLTEDSLRELEAQRESGARVYAQVMPRPFDMNMRLAETSMLLFALPQWKSIMDMPFADRVERFSDPQMRKVLVDELAAAKGMSMAIPLLVVGDVRAEQNQAYRGKSLMQIARDEGKPLGEVILDISLADDLQAEFQLKGILNADRAAVGELLAHDLVHFGASDAGAHITQFCGTGDTSYMLQYYVRETQQIPLETAIFHMTGELARDWGISDRGRIEVGLAADLVLFDLETVGCSSEIFRNDFPGEANRYIREAAGYDVVIVNGEIVLRDGEYTEARPGVVV